MKELIIKISQDENFTINFLLEKEEFSRLESIALIESLKIQMINQFMSKPKTKRKTK